MYIINCTQHIPSAEQCKAGVGNISGKGWGRIKELLTFESIPSAQEMKNRASEIGKILADWNAFQDEYNTNYACDKVMIGGAPFFMGYLEKELFSRNFQPVYAFSKRESVEVDGVKKSVFRHLGFIPVEKPKVYVLQEMEDWHGSFGTMNLGVYSDPETAQRCREKAQLKGKGFTQEKLDQVIFVDEMEVK